MRARRSPQASMLAPVDPESRVPAGHPIRAVRALADAALAELSPVFDALDAEGGRPSVPPERRLKASLLMALYPVRSERSFCEQLDDNLLVRWFLGMGLVEPSFDPTVFTNEPPAAAAPPRRAGVLRRGGRPGAAARLVFMAHALMENRNGLLADLQTTEADGYAERDAALEMLDQAADRGFRPKTVAADKLDDVREFVGDLRLRGVTPHVARNTNRRRSAVDARTTRHPGDDLSQKARRRIEEVWGWMKTVGAFRRTRYRGVARTALAAYLVGAAYNLVRIANLRRAGPLPATA